MTVPLRLEAPAKLNLGLRVTGRRDDGRHELDSIFVLLDLADRLLLLPGCSGLRLDGPRADGVPVDERNLAWRGLVAGLGGTPELACLTVDKQVPSEAGLGGGSSDAGAAWRLGRAWRGLPEDVADEERRALSAIGADVPFFASGLAAARVRGIGERIEPVPAVVHEVVLVVPPFGISTAAAFAELRADEWGSADNDLLAAAVRQRPQLGELVDTVRRAGGRPRLTGSGSTIFSLADDRERARRLADALRDRGLSVILTRTRTTAPRIEPIEEEGP